MAGSSMLWTGAMSAYTAAVSSTYSGPVSSASSSAVGVCTWYFLLRIVACAAGAGHVDAMPRVGVGIRGVREVDGMVATGPAGRSGGPDVKHIR